MTMSQGITSENNGNLDVVDDMDKEQLDELARILDKLK